MYYLQISIDLVICNRYNYISSQDKAEATALTVPRHDRRKLVSPMQTIIPAEVIALLNIWPDACEIGGVPKTDCDCLFCQLEAVS